MPHCPNFAIDRVIVQAKALWHSILNKNDMSINFDDNFVTQFPLLEVVDTTHSTIAIYNYHKFHPEFITKNVKDILGISQDDLLLHGSKLLYKHLHPNHIHFPLSLAKLLKPHLERNENGDIHKRQLLATLCGLRFNHPEKGEIRILMQQSFIDHEHPKPPFRVVATMRDITHLMKADSYFIRILHGDKRQFLHAFHSGNEAHIPSNDILSSREIEVLRLISKDKNTDEMAEYLGISRNTVRNHRQNMLDRLGAKDTTALLELARICHFL